MFDNSARKIPTERNNIFAHCPKMMKKFMFFPENFFSSGCSSAHVEYSFDNPVEMLPTKGRKLSALVQK